MKKDKPKKPIFKRWWFWLIVAALVFGVLTPGQSTTQPTQNTTAESADASLPKSELSFTLSSDDPGEYGEEVVLNANTENEYHFFAFHIPAGDYRVSFGGTKGGVQVTFCDDGIFTRDDGMEEVISAEQRPIVVMAGETYNFHINDGQYIKLSDSSKNVFFEKLE